MLFMNLSARSKKRGEEMKSPLADRIRPKNLEDIVGQEHLLSFAKNYRRWRNS